MASQYNHNQAAASASWMINHGLNSNSVVIDVMVDVGGNLEKVLPLDIRVVDADNVRVDFSSAQSGHARVVGEFTIF